MFMAPKSKLSFVAGLLLVGMACQSENEIITGPVDVNPGDITECGFTPISGTRFSRYDCNPVFTNTGEDWGKNIGSIGYHAQEILGHPFYQMWYSAYSSSDGTGYGLGYAISADGTNWETHEANPLFEEPVDGGWDKSSMSGMQPIWDAENQMYYMMYQGINLDTGKTKLGMYESPDGLNWTQSPQSPLLDFAEEYAGNSYCWPLALTKTSDGVLNGYLAGGPRDLLSPTGTCQIYRFTGEDFDNISLDNEPVLAAGPDNYDKAGMTSAAVVEFGDTHYMFYSGFVKWTEVNQYFVSATNVRLSVATSPDGVNWTKDADNPKPVHASESGYIGDVSAQKIGNRIHLWITDYYEEEDDSAVGYFYYEPEIEPHP
jgi:beta-1,2-mannobiose phosphorylase / 1,2-beta-oligomannan phosphorylase